MSKEHVQLTTLLKDAHTEHDGNFEFTIGSLRANTLILMQCGIGKVNAAVGTTSLIRRYEPDCIISCRQHVHRLPRCHLSRLRARTITRYAHPFPQ